MNPRIILLVIRLLLVFFPAVIGLFGWSGRQLGTSARRAMPPDPAEDVGSRPLRAPLPPLSRETGAGRS